MEIVGYVKFLVFQNLENIQIEKNEETKAHNDKLNNNKFIEEMSKLYSPFIINRLKLNLIDAICYSVIPKNKALW